MDENLLLAIFAFVGMLAIADGIVHVVADFIGWLVRRAHSKRRDGIKYRVRYLGEGYDKVAERVYGDAKYFETVVRVWHEQMSDKYASVPGIAHGGGEWIELPNTPDPVEVD